MSFSDFWRKRLAGILKFNYSCPEEVSEKKLFFHKISYSHESFLTLGKKFKTLSYFVRQGHRESNLCARRYFVTKNKMFKMFQRKVFFCNCFRTMIGKVWTFEKKIVLVLKTLFYVSKGTFSEKFFVSKSSFCVKIYRPLRENFSEFWRNCFRQGCHPFSLLLPRKVSGKIFSKKSFCHFFQTWSKKSTFEKHQDECENFILRVRWKFLRKNIFWSYLFYFFSGISSEKLLHLKKISPEL